jgi:hypothetical protein
MNRAAAAVLVIFKSVSSVVNNYLLWPTWWVIVFGLVDVRRVVAQYDVFLTYCCFERITA